MGAGNGNPVWLVFWLLVLIFVSHIVCLFCAWWFVFFGPLAVCLKPLKSISDLLMRGITFPVLCAESMMGMKSPC